MRKNINQSLVIMLTVSVAFISCKKSIEETSIKHRVTTENASNTQSRLTLTSTGTCFECPNLILNESFENVTAPVPGVREHFKNGQVPNWLNAASSPDVLNQSGLPNMSPIPLGFDGVHFTYLGTQKLNNGQKEEETIMQIVNFYTDKDIEYCLSYLDSRMKQTSNGSFSKPGEILVHLAYNVPVYTGNNQQTAVDFMAYSGREIKRSTPSTTAWNKRECTFKADKFYNRILFSPKIVEPAAAFTGSMLLLDKIQLSCYTDALKDINAVFSGNNLNVSPVFVGLPSSVSIVKYEWTVRNADNNLSSTQANPTFQIKPSANPLQVCLKITDSRGCCASICVDVENDCGFNIEFNPDPLVLCNEQISGQTLVSVSPVGSTFGSFQVISQNGFNLFLTNLGNSLNPSASINIEHAAGMAPGTYLAGIVSLSNSAGCTETDSIFVIIEDCCPSYACTDRFGAVTYVENCAQCLSGANLTDLENCSCEWDCRITASLNSIDPCSYDNDGLLMNVGLTGSGTCVGSNGGTFVYTWYRNGVVIATTNNPTLNLDNDDYIPSGQPGGPHAVTAKYGGNGEYWFIVTNEGCCPGKSSESNHIVVSCF